MEFCHDNSIGYWIWWVGGSKYLLQDFLPIFYDSTLPQFRTQPCTICLVNDCRVMTLISRSFISINVVDSIPHVSLAFKNTACLDDVFKPNQVIFSGPAFLLQNAPNFFDLYTNAIAITLNKPHTLKAP